MNVSKFFNNTIESTRNAVSETVNVKGASQFPNSQS